MTSPLLLRSCFWGGDCGPCFCGRVAGDAVAANTAVDVGRFPRAASVHDGVSLGQESAVLRRGTLFPRFNRGRDRARAVAVELESLYRWSIASIALAAYTLIVALLRHSRERLIEFAGQFGIPRRIDAEVKKNLQWLSTLTVLAVAVVVHDRLLESVLALLGSICVHQSAIAVAIQFLTFGLLAEAPLG